MSMVSNGEIDGAIIFLYLSTLYRLNGLTCRWATVGRALLRRTGALLGGRRLTPLMMALRSFVIVLLGKRRIMRRYAARGDADAFFFCLMMMVGTLPQLHASP